MPLKVLSIAFPFAPVGPDSVGGSEQILSDLDRALLAAGHSSVVIACEGSRTAGKLVPIPLPDLQSFNRDDHNQNAPCCLDDAAKAGSREKVQETIDFVIRSEHPDLIHMHGLDFHEYSVPAEIPVLVTVHMPIPWYPPTAWTRLRGSVRFVCVSDSQRRTCPPALRNPIVIGNGVAIPSASVTNWRKDFALVLGRICPEKNEHQALEAGTLAGVPVLLAGQVFPYRDHQKYFDEKIAPQLHSNGNGVQHRFLGPLEPEERDRLLSEARCLLHPTLAPETSSLVAMEALAAATPVIAFRSGALSEIVEHGITGFLVNNVNEMANAIGKVQNISPYVCRAAAEARFNKTRMISRYFELYESMVCAARPEPLHA